MKRYKFSARIEPADAGGAYVLFPFDVEKVFGTKGKVQVKATFNGVPYAGSLIKYRHPQHMLPMLKSIRKQTGLSPGDTVAVELWPDNETRTLEVPPAFQSALEKHKLVPFFESLSYTHRKEYCRWVSEAKKEETRLKRLDKAIHLLKNGIKTPDSPKSRA